MEITSKRFTSAAKTMPSNRDQLLERQQLEVQEGHLHRQERERPRDRRKRRKRRKRHRHALSGQEVGVTPLGLVQR